MIKIAIVYHSETGNTKRMAELIEEGCRKVPDIEARTMAIDELDEAYVAQARAVLFGGPT
ncbi:MAG: flavodoxin domain-containing protein [Candidatus Latescibacteria bacterium]|nr:flavodoxin domain-containing protein [Candidatus Latescibacterota bacterium]